MAEETLGVRARRLRHAKGYSLDGLARVTGLSKTHVQMIEKGRRTHMRRDTLDRYAKALGVTQRYLESGYEPLTRNKSEWKGVRYEVALRAMSDLDEKDVRAIAQLIRRLEKQSAKG